jgi:NAD(P)-dependent dehydrogenase (short-subunit alcohol dehydrogenase family)
MNELIGRVAVVTGAARGVGRSVAERAAREGMCVVVADVNEEELRPLARRLRKRGAEVLAVPTDVSRPDAVALLARRTIEAFGAVHLLFNCASIGAAGFSWDATRTAWESALNVNLWGTIYSIQEFVPLMLAQGTPGHVVNAVSPEAFLPLSPSAPIQSANAAVVALTENLEHGFRWLSSPLHASVLCRSWLSQSTSRRVWARQTADAAFDGIRDQQLYIVTESAFVDTVRERFDAIAAALPR